MKSAVAVPPRIVAKLRAICLALPEVVEEQAWVGTRWTIRRRNFAHVVTIADGWPPAYARAAGADGTVLTFRTAGLLHDTLRTAGPPFFDCPWGTRWGAHVIGMRLGPRPDWDQVAMLATESYGLLAPKRVKAAGRSAARRQRG